MSEDRIRELAYLKWEQAGYPPGDGVQFWVEAEKELSQANGQESRRNKKEKVTAVSANTQKEPAKVAAKTSGTKSPKK